MRPVAQLAGLLEIGDVGDPRVNVSAIREQPFGTAEAYRQTVRQMVGTGTLLDAGMVYFDARLSEHYPTLEVRIADVCLHADDAVLIAALCRALVDTEARSWRAQISREMSSGQIAEAQRQAREWLLVP